MNAKRVTMALLVSLIVSGLFTFWLSRHVAKANHVAAPQKHLVVAASKNLQAGELLKPGSLHLIEWPSNLPGSFLKVEEVSGRIVLYPLPADQPILSTHLAPAGVSVGLAANIPSGMRAISVRSDEVVGVSGFLLPGTHVDVLLTYRSDRSPEQRTVPVLQDVVVLASGQQMRPDPEGKAAVSNVVTLLLKPEDSAKLVLATSLGAIHFVLRNGADTEQGTASSVGLDELAGIPAPLTPADPLAKPMPPKPKAYAVETIMGDKRVVKTFD